MLLVGSAEAEAVTAADATHVFHLGTVFAFTSFSQDDKAVHM